MNSFTEENYLKAIYKLMEVEGDNVSTNSIAKEMDIKASAVTDMLKKMSDKELINYEKYQGVNLTAKGKKEALLVIRKHRLWEVFLVQVLHFKWDQVHQIAEQLEHINSEELIKKLDHFLNYPKYDPHGDPIPDPEGNIHGEDFKLLCYLEKGIYGVMTGVADHTPSFLQHLDKIGLNLGAKILVKDKIDYDKSMEISVNGAKSIFISNEVCKNILLFVE